MMNASCTCTSRRRSPGDGPRKPERRGFTLIELLVVVAIIALLISIMLPTMARARAQARQVACQSNMHQHVYACMMYAHDYGGTLPRNATQQYSDVRKHSWWIDTVYAGYDPEPPVGRGVYDLRALMKKYVSNQVEIFSCPANGGPRLDSPETIEQTQRSQYLGAQVMMLYNSTCVFKGTSLEKPWAPKVEWRAGGTPAVVPILQDEYTASGPSVGALNKFVFNHGKGSSRTNNAGIPSYTNFPTASSRSGCVGANVSYLDGHVSWVRNMRVGNTARWTLEVPWSGAAAPPPPASR